MRLRHLSVSCHQSFLERGGKGRHSRSGAGRASHGTSVRHGHPPSGSAARACYVHLGACPVLVARKGSVVIPVYVGDAMQLSVRRMLYWGRIDCAGARATGWRASGQDRHWRKGIAFSESVCRDPALLDSVVHRMQIDSENGRDVAAFRGCWPFGREGSERSVPSLRRRIGCMTSCGAPDEIAQSQPAALSRR